MKIFKIKNQVFYLLIAIFCGFTSSRALAAECGDCIGGLTCICITAKNGSATPIVLREEEVFPGDDTCTAYMKPGMPSKLYGGQTGDPARVLLRTAGQGMCRKNAVGAGITYQKVSGPICHFKVMKNWGGDCTITKGSDWDDNYCDVKVTENPMQKCYVDFTVKS